MAIRKFSKNPVPKAKREIQKLLHKFAVLTYGDCVLRNYPESGRCGGVLHAEHLISRQRNITYGDSRNIILLCAAHHLFFKPRNGMLYWELVRKIVGEKRWEWLKRTEADRKSYSYTLWDWQKVILQLKKEIRNLENL